MNETLSHLRELLAAGIPVVRVVVARVRGSAPREAGASMLVTACEAHGTIGGGHLEFVATEAARRMLQEEGSSTRIDRFSLGASLGQCCGGIVELAFLRHDARDIAMLEAARVRAAQDRGAMLATALGTAVEPRHRLVTAREAAGLAAGDFLLEPLASHATPLWIFGAGHVGRALVRVLDDLAFEITWVDSREAGFPARLRKGVHARHAPQPADEVVDMPPGAWALVVTHSHDEDYALCEALLRLDTFAWLGLIGSGPKAARFRQRLARRGFSEARIARITTPIGIGGIADKRPAAIAVAVAAQLLQLREAGSAAALPAARSA